ncbi:MAG: hypothetical protein K8S55_08800, partial [Phycisphaerae bacterium]|nr:hypothetical protein [Phycisphaerae bacterium]
MLKSLLMSRVCVSLLLMAVLTTGANAGILSSRFGVTPSIDLTDGRADSNQGGATSYHFSPGSLAPTLNTSTVNYTVDDWWGSWSNTSLSQYTDWSYTGQSGGLHPSGEEPYDVEAIYFDNDATNLYIAVITSHGPNPG